MLRYLTEQIGLSKIIHKSPDFIIVGAQKSGTTYLYNLLVQHKGIISAKKKEVHFFDNNLDKGIDWYLSQFPLKLNNKYTITGESSPYYLYHPLAAERIYNFDKKIKIIILLRNPIERAISHINMMIHRHGLELNTPNFCDIENESIIQKALTDNLKNKTIKKSNIHQDFSFFQRGIYINQVKRYMNYFKMYENLLILKSEDFFNNTTKQLYKIFNFLGVSNEMSNIDFTVTNFSGNYNGTNFTECRDKLKVYYEQYNKELENLLNINMNWD